MRRGPIIGHANNGNTCIFIRFNIIKYFYHTMIMSYSKLKKTYDKLKSCND